MNAAISFRPVHLGPVDTRRIDEDDGSILLHSAVHLEHYPSRLTERLIKWAAEAPDRVFIARRGQDGAWISLSYRETLVKVRSIGQALLDRGLSADRPIAILSENGIEHALLALAAMHVGIPYTPVSPAYSLMSSDFGKLKHIADLMRPGLVFAADGGKFERALRFLSRPGIELVVADAAPDGLAATRFDLLSATAASSAVEAAFDHTGPETVAKVLFTSGSTGHPKGVINTQRMLCANQQQLLQSFPFFGDEPPVLIDWLPWNHTFGGNHNFGLVLYNGGSFYIDDGKPVPGGIEATLANLREIAPTVYFNVPKGFEDLIPRFEADVALREKFFSRLKMLFYAGAGLPQHVWTRLEELAAETCGERIAITTGLGCTESGPSALFANWVGSRSGLLGVPVPGLTLKLVPIDDKYEARYRGPNIMPGYWRQPEVTAAAFDDEGFYRTGDALKFVDPDDANMGLLFDGRIAEDFKLSTGTWVSVGTLRAALVAACAPLVQDAVITGHDRDDIGAILFPNLAACRAAAALPDSAGLVEVAEHPAIRAMLQSALATFAAASTGSANRVDRAVVAAVAPSIDAGEVTDKGSLNQRAVLRERADIVAALYAEPPASSVIRARKG